MNIFGVKINKNKKVRYALTSLYGIGLKTSCNICDKLGISRNIVFSELTEKQIFNIIKHIEQNYIIENNLRKNNYLNILKLVNIKNYRGFRHKNNLPVRGQRSSTNGHTQKLLKRFSKTYG